MKQTFVTVFIYIATIIAVSAVAKPELATNFPRTGVDTGDVMMPSLAELLGEDVDDFGEFDIFAELKEDIVGYASKYLGTRYRSGGKGPAGFDCSGFTSFVFRNFGYELSPTSSQQGLQGESVNIDEVEVGDLMFFSGRRGGKTVGHVGMVIDVDHENGTCKFIHSSTSQGVVVQNFPDGGYYSKRFLHARRVLDNEDSL